MTSGQAGERKTWWLSVAAVLGLGLFIVFFELEGYRTLTKHEGFVAVVSREMLQTGDWVVPRFGGLPRLKKPPLAYWSAASVSWLFGEHAAWTCRFPFAVSALVLAGLVGVWAGRWYGRWCGLAAALVQISSVYVISFSRKAEVDMLLCLLTTGALFLVANWNPSAPRRETALRWMGIYTLIGLAWLAKFHYGPAMVLGVIGMWLIIDRRWPGLWDVFNPAGLVILAAAVVIWPWLLLQRVPEAWEIWQTETIGRALGKLGREPVWFYVPQVIVQALPWSLLLGKAGRESFLLAWKEGDRRERFLWVWFFTQFAILTASAFKHHHYLMATMPALSLILGRALVSTWLDLRDGRIPITRRQLVSFGMMMLIISGAAAVGITRKWPHLQSPAIALGLCLAACGLLMCLCFAKRRWTAAAVSAGFGFAVCYGIVTAMIFPQRDRRLPQVEWTRSLRDVVPPQQAICVYGLKEDPIVYYLEGSLFRAETPAGLSQGFARDDSLIVITDETYLPDLKDYHLDRQPLPRSHPMKTSPLVLVKLSPAKLATAPKDSQRF